MTIDIKFDDHIITWKKWKERERVRIWRVKNQNRITEYGKQYYHNNQDQIKQRVKNHYIENIDQIKNQTKLYRIKNKDKIKLRMKEYRLMNLFKIREFDRERYRKNRELYKTKKREYYNRNKELFKTRMKEYREQNLEKIRQYDRVRNKTQSRQQYHKKLRSIPDNRQKKGESDKKYYQRNTDKIKAKIREWQNQNPEKVLISQKRHLEKLAKPWNMKGSEYTRAFTNWSKVIKKDKKCQICGDIANEAHHIFYRKFFPQMSFILNNGIALCKRCHNEVHLKNINKIQPLKPRFDIRNYAWVKVT